MPAVMRKRPRSSFATSLTISFWSEMTVERWSYRETMMRRRRELVTDDEAGHGKDNEEKKKKR